MGQVKLQRTIFLLKKENKKLKIQLRYVTKRAMFLSRLVHKYESNFNIDDNIDPDSDSFKECQLKSISQKVSDPIQNDFQTNLTISKYHREYSPESKFFSYTIYATSSSAYRVVRGQIPLPSEQILRKTFSPYINIVKKELTNIQYVKELFEARESLFPDEEIKCCLSVDAFSINTFSTNNNYSFIFLILPFNRNYRIFPVHLYSANTGNANTTTFQKMREIVQQSLNTKFKIVLFSVDGDRYYDPFFSKSFDYIYPFFTDLFLYNFTPIFELFENVLIEILSSDWLHLLKNFRSKILTDLTVVNPFSKNPPINSQQLENILKLGSALLDKGSLAKLHDCHPLNLFTIGNSLKLFFNSNSDAFFIFLILGFWNESMLNTKLSLKCRQFFLESILFVFIKIFQMLDSKPLPNTVSFKKNEGKKVLWVSKHKLMRLIITILSQLYALNLKDSSMAFDRFSNQPTENFIGLIRMLCGGDDSFQTIVHNLSRYEFVNRNSKDIYIHSQPKRLNAGGCQLIDADIDFNFNHTSIDLANLLFDYMLGDFNEDLMKELIIGLEQITEDAPYRTRNIPNRTSGSKILSRLFAISEYKKKIESKEWSKEEICIIRQMLLSRTEILTKENYDRFQCDENQLKMIVDDQFVELSKRDWTIEEDHVITSHMYTTIKNKDLAQLLICRTVKDVKKRRSSLKKALKNK